MFETSKTFLHFHSRCCGRKAARNVQQSTHHATDSEMSYRSKTASNHKPVNRSVRKRRHQRHPPSTTMGSNPTSFRSKMATHTHGFNVRRSITLRKHSAPLSIHSSARGRFRFHQLVRPCLLLVKFLRASRCSLGAIGKWCLCLYSRLGLSSACTNNHIHAVSVFHCSD